MRPAQCQPVAGVPALSPFMRIRTTGTPTRRPLATSTNPVVSSRNPRDTDRFASFPSSMVKT